jgi:hypothetical protein
MKLLPYEHVEYETKLSLEDIRERLAADLEPEKLFSLPRNTYKKFAGHFNDNVFEIRPIVEGRNSFLPMIKGTVYDEGNRRIVIVQMRLHLVIILFLCIWYGLLVKITIPFIEELITKGEYNPIIPAIALFYLFPYVLTMIGFKPEAEKALDYLKELFENENNIA